LHLNRAAGFHVIGNLHARAPDPVQFMLCAFLPHASPPFWLPIQTCSFHTSRPPRLLDTMQSGYDSSSLMPNVSRTPPNTESSLITSRSHSSNGISPHRAAR